MHKQREVLEEILGNIHMDTPDDSVLRELIYTAEETGMIDPVYLDEIETVVKIFSLAVMYTQDKTNVPEAIRM